MTQTLFPFETYLPPSTNYKLDDGAGTIIILPRYGCLTWIEDRLVNTYFLKEVASDTPLSEAKAELVSRLLQYRARTEQDAQHDAPLVPKEEVLVLPDGRPFPSTLVEAIYNYFTVSEASGWKEDKDEPVPPSPEQQAEIAKTEAASGKKK